MRAFLIQSIVASVILTLAINLLPRLFPRAAEKGERRVREGIERSMAERAAGDGATRRGGVRVFFPWKAMIIISIVLTVLVNAVGYFAK